MGGRTLFGFDDENLEFHVFPIDTVEGGEFDLGRGGKGCFEVEEVGGLECAGVEGFDAEKCAER